MMKLNLSEDVDKQETRSRANIHDNFSRVLEIYMSIKIIVDFFRFVFSNNGYK